MATNNTISDKIKPSYFAIPNKFAPSYKDPDTPTRVERSISVWTRNSQDPKNIEKYENFDRDISSYLSKIPNEVIRSIIVDLLNKKMIYMGHLAKYQSGITGTLLFNSNSDELLGIVVEVNNLEIDFSDGSITRQADVVYAIYLQYIRASILAGSEEVLKDTELLNLSEKYFNYLIVKILKLSYLSEKQRVLFDITTSVFFNMFYARINSNIALEKAITKYCPDSLQDEVANIISAERMKRYVKFNDLFNAYYDNKAILDDPNNNVRKFLQGIKLHGYLYISTSLDYLIATACASKYNFSNIITCFIDNKLQSHIEDISISKYSNKLKYDSSTVKYF